MRLHGFLMVMIWLGLAAGCGVDVPFDPVGAAGPLSNALEDVGRVVENALEDPLGARPYPVLMGGDTERVFYATNLTEVKVNFPGPTNDIVLPGVLGPSNVYQYRDKKRQLMRPLVPTGEAFGLATDGEWLAFVAISDLAEAEFSVLAGPLGSFESEVVFADSAGSSRRVVPSRLALDSGRLVFVLADGDAEYLRIEDLLSISPAIEIVARRFGAFALLGDQLAFVEESDDGTVDVVLRDLATDDETLVAADLRVERAEEIDLGLAANSLAWSVPTQDGLTSVFRYGFGDDSTRLWSEAVAGRLAGASDDYFVTEELRSGGATRAEKFVVRKYDRDGRERTLADYRADGLAGQTQVIGRFAAWVNPERRVVLAPLAGGDRQIFRPF